MSREVSEGGQRKMPRRLAILSALLMAGMLAVATSTSVFAQSVLRVVPWSDLQSLDPVSSTDRPTRMHGFLVFDTLFAPDEKQRPQLQMVESHIASPDRLTHTLTLRDGLTFHDGTAVTAEDCVASIKRWGVRDPFGQLFMAAAESIVAKDTKTLEIKLRSRFPLLTEALANGTAGPPFIMPKRLAETDPFKAITEAVGSGPFTFAKEEWVPGSKVVYRKNERYVPRKDASSGLAGAKIVNLDRIEFTSFRDPQTALAALQAGEVDYWPNPPVDLVPILQKTHDINTRVLSSLGTQPLIRLNHLQPPFNNVKARAAMLWLIRQEDYLQAIGDPPGMSRACPSVYGCDTPYETAAGSEALMGYDPKKAIALFQEAGWDIKKPIVILHVADRPELTATTLLLADAMRKAGIAAQLVTMDAAAMFQRRGNKGPVDQGGWNIFAVSTTGSLVVSPITNLFVTASCEKAFFGWPCDEMIERLRTEFVTAETEADRFRVAESIQKRAYELAIYAPLGQRAQIGAHRNSVSGFLPAGIVDVFWNIRKTK